MNLLTSRLLREHTPIENNENTELIWKKITKAYDLLAHFIDYKSFDGHVYQLQCIDNNFLYSYSIYRNGKLIEESDKLFDTQEKCYIRMRNVSYNYIGYGYYELFEYSPIESSQNDTTIKTIPDQYMSKIHISYTPDKITIQFITPDDDGNEKNANLYEIKMTEKKV